MESIIFDHPFLSFAPNLAPFVRADDVGYAVSQFISRQGDVRYPISALTEAKVARVRLDGRFRDESDEDNLALILRIPASRGLFTFEIIVRSDLGTFYAGCIQGTQLQILDHFQSHYRKLRCINGISTSDYAFCASSKRFELCTEA